jgi:hypothetical protein
MTEYDYSDEAYERYLATQNKIARWVDKTLEQPPCNPFAPSERSATQTPQLAYHATIQGDISPSYSNSPSYSSSRTHEHSQWHSPGQRSTPLITPQARPLLGRSFSGPPPSAQFSPYPPAYSTPPSRIPSPYSSRYQPSPMPHLSRTPSQNSFHSVRSPHMHANPVIQQQQHGGNTYPYSPPSLPQAMPPVVVVRGDRSFTVVPPPGHHVQVFVCFYYYHVPFVAIHSVV